MKDLLSNPPVLAAPEPRELMLLYITATNKVISVVTVVEREEEGHENKVHRPTYYLSEVLTESKQRYPHHQKLAYGVFFASRKLRHYFQEHKITVVSTAPLRDIINNRDATGRVAKLGIELATFNIEYKPHTAIKSQILADFVVDWTETAENSGPPDSEFWTLHFDGSKARGGSGAGVVLKSPQGDKLFYVLQIHFTATNNIAEYEALLHGIRMAKNIGVTRLYVLRRFRFSCSASIQYLQCKQTHGVLQSHRG